MVEYLAVHKRGTTEPLHRLAGLASALAGRRIAVQFHDLSKQVGYADWQCIHVPISFSELDQQFLVIAQALMLRSGGLRRSLLIKLVGRPMVAERYLMAEIARTVAEHRWLVPRRFSEAACLRQFKQQPADSQESYALASTGQRLTPAPAYFGVLRVSYFLRSPQPDDANALSAGQVAKFDFNKTTSAAEIDDEDAEDSLIMRLLRSPFNAQGTGLMQAMFNSLFGSGTTAKGGQSGESSGGEMQMGQGSQLPRKGVFARLLDIRGLSDHSHVGGESGTHSYAEWDCHKKRYRSNWAVVEEVDPWSDEPDVSLREQLVPASRDLLRRLSGIGLSFELHRNEQDGEELILDKVVDYLIAVRTGAIPDDRVYRASRKTKRDLAVMVLLDVSGSTAELGTEGGLSIHHQQASLAYKLVSALQRLGDQVGLFGYHSWGRNLVRFHRLKSFHDPLDMAVVDRMCQLETIGYTRTGAALRHASQKLADEMGLSQRLLIVISDGFAYDQDYEGAYAEGDTQKALEEVRAGGTGCLCLSVGSSQEYEKLQSIFGSAATLSVRNDQEFIGNIRPVFLRALLGAGGMKQRIRKLNTGRVA